MTDLAARLRELLSDELMMRLLRSGYGMRMHEKMRGVLMAALEPVLSSLLEAQLEDMRKYLQSELAIVEGDYPSPDREVLERVMAELQRLASSSSPAAPQENKP